MEMLEFRGYTLFVDSTAAHYKNKWFKIELHKQCGFLCALDINPIGNRYHFRGLYVYFDFILKITIFLMPQFYRILFCF